MHPVDWSKRRIAINRHELILTFYVLIHNSVHPVNQHTHWGSESKNSFDTIVLHVRFCLLKLYVDIWWNLEIQITCNVLVVLVNSTIQTCHRRNETDKMILDKRKHVCLLHMNIHHNKLKHDQTYEAKYTCKQLSRREIKTSWSVYEIATKSAK